MTRSISAALKAQYASGTTTIALCWQATLKDGTVVRATTHTERIEFPVGSGQFYEPAIGFTPSDIESAADLSVSNMEVDGFLAAPGITVEDVRSGRWDYAELELFEVNYRDLSMGRNILPTSGTLGELSAKVAGKDIGIFTTELRSLSQKLSRRIVNLTMQTCMNDLGDARCGVNLAPWTVTCSVDSITEGKIISVNGRTEPTDWFTGGKVTFLTGSNAGRSMEVKRYTLSSGVGIFELFEAMPDPIIAADTPGTPFPPAGGGDPAPAVPDTFTVNAGCMKRFYEDCIGKFNNVVGPGDGQGFRGFPHLPGVGVFGGPGTKLTPTPVIAHSPAPAPGSPPPPPPPAPTPPPPAPAPSSGGSGAYPFASRLVPYAAGVIQPADTAANFDAFIKSQYLYWKGAILKSTGSAIGGIPAGSYWPQFSDPSASAVSEGMGYAMLITAVMAGYDADAQTIFDGLYKFVKAFPCSGPGSYGATVNPTAGANLMSWRIGVDGSDQGGGWPALDGELDIGLALLMAARQWGSGAYNYTTEAAARIGAMKALAFSNPGDGTLMNSQFANGARTSDYMLGHFRAFKAATGDTIWDGAVSKQVGICNYMQANYSPSAGLLPDWIEHVDTSSPAPSSGAIGDGGGNPHENAYWYNACRDPWRFGADYVLSGDAGVKAILNRMENFFRADSGGNPTQLVAGYALNGSHLVGVNPGGYINPEFQGPIMVGAMCDAGYQGWLDANWAYMKAHPTTGYYATEIQLLTAFVVSGNWWKP